MDNTPLQINPAFKPLLKKVWLSPQNFDHIGADWQGRLVRKQIKAKTQFIPECNEYYTKLKKKETKLGIAYKPELIMNLKETFNTRLPPHNFNSQEIEYVLKASDPGSQSIKIKDSNGNSTENSHNIDKFQIQELKNSSSYKEILNYRSGDYFKERRSSEKVNLNSSFCEGLSLNQKKTLSMSGKITSSKICYSDLWSWQMKKAIAAKRAKLSNIPLIIQNNDLSMFQLEKVFKKAKNDSKPRNPDFSPTPIKELLKNQGFAKLSHKFTQNTQIPNELRVSPFPMLDKRKSIDANKSIDLIIEACGIEHASILNLGSRLEKDRYDISNKHKFINDLAKIRTTNFRKSEKEELVKYQLLPKEMTDSKMFQSLSKKKLLVFESRSQSRRNTKSSNN